MCVHNHVRNRLEISANVSWACETLISFLIDKTNVNATFVSIGTKTVITSACHGTKVT